MQSDGVQIAVGSANFDSFSWSIGTRVFVRDFDSDFLIDNPGYNAFGDASPFLPDGYFALPASSSIGWDFLPMTVGSADANLLYWNGQDTNSSGGVDAFDVAFSRLPGRSISLVGSGGTAIADGSATLVIGSTLVTTDSTGAVHSHRNYRLDDGDMNASTNPVDGIYLVALRLRMAGLESSDPLFLAFGTPGSTLRRDNAAVAWIEGRVDTLVHFNLPGDYNDDKVVDAADYTVWRDSLNLAIALPNEAASPNVVDVDDFGVWKSHFGQTAGGGTGRIASTSVPEPKTVSALLLAIAVVPLFNWREKRRRRVPGSAPPQH